MTENAAALLEPKVVSTLVDGHPVEPAIVEAHEDLLVVFLHEIPASLEHEPLFLTEVVDMLPGFAALDFFVVFLVFWFFFRIGR